MTILRLVVVVSLLLQDLESAWEVYEIPSHGRGGKRWDSKGDCASSMKEGSWSLLWSGMGGKALKGERYSS